MRSRITISTMMAVVAVLFLSTVRQGLCGDLYVSPSGKDDNPGTKEKPFRTIAHARDRVAKLNSKMTEDVIVHLRGGTYELSSPVVFDANDSGANGHRVVYKAYTGETPIVSGGKAITGWSIHDQEENIYKAPVGELEFRQIYVSGTRCVRARQPNRTHEETLGEYWGGAGVTGQKPHQLKVSASELSEWDNLEEVEVVMLTHWKQKRARISSFSGQMISFQSPENSARSMHHLEQGGTPHFYENAYEFLDAAGEFYLNTKKGVLYYKPREGENMSSVEVMVPTVETLFDISGQSPSNMVHDILFEGITFQYSNWTTPNSKGYQVMQSATWLESDERSPVPGAVQFHNAGGIEMRACTVRRTGAHGIAAVNDIVSDCSIIGNLVSDTAAGGIYLLLNHETSTGNRITDNTVENIGMYYTDGCGILVARTPDVTIHHNEIRRVRYTGISTGWTWNDKDTAARNHDVGFNLIHRTMRLHDDGGGIYTLGKIEGMNIHDNYIHSITRSKHSGGYGIAGVYLDNGSCYKHVANNVIDNLEAAFFSGNKPNHHNLFEQNYYNTMLGKIEEGNTVSSNTLVKGSSWPAAALKIMEKAGPRGSYRRPDKDGWKYDRERATGVVDAALACDGKSVCVVAPHAPEFEPEQLTLEAWIHMAEFPGGRDPRRWIVNKNVNELTEGHYALVINGDRVGAYLNIGGGPANLHGAWSPSGALKRNQWQHLAMTYDGSTMTVFLDGIEAATKAVNQKRGRGVHGLAIGRRQDAFTYFKGRIDEVRIFDRALDAAELKGHYDKPAPVKDGKPEKGMVGYWPF